MNPAYENQFYCNKIMYKCSHEKVGISLFHHSQDYCIKRFILVLNSSVFQHLPALSKERCCSHCCQETLSGLIFGKREWTNQLFVVASSHQSAVRLCLCGRASLLFFPLSLPAHLRLVQGTGAGLWHQPVDQIYFIYTKYGVGAPIRDEIRLVLFCKIAIRFHEFIYFFYKSTTHYAYWRW